MSDCVTFDDFASKLLLSIARNEAEKRELASRCATMKEEIKRKINQLTDERKGADAVKADISALNRALTELSQAKMFASAALQKLRDEKNSVYLQVINAESALSKIAARKGELHSNFSTRVERMNDDMWLARRASVAKLISAVIEEQEVEAGSCPMDIGELV